MSLQWFERIIDLCETNKLLNLIVISFELPQIWDFFLSPFFHHFSQPLVLHALDVGGKLDPFGSGALHSHSASPLDVVPQRVRAVSSAARQPVHDRSRRVHDRSAGGEEFVRVLDDAHA